MLVQRSLFRARGALNLAKRGFAAAGGHGHDDHHHGDDHHGAHGDHHGDHHDDHHDDHHHHIEKADGEHKFLTQEANKKTLVFDGLKASENATFELDNIYRHHNDLPLLQ
jgi:hypothetical protein